ncbi:hypothetical protein F5876DRAFT_78355 [Lentinula aff. lateritia]|uniref:Uncharacterized protein n=1 Tax=Lentinula aff. lateritia TaxID=2804960 RepID=A0ACC1TVM6_9AGAR|nr:hypothetical protein F5876DRAFT_78355 [Lentinula aff. lateritia]
MDLTAPVHRDPPWTQTFPYQTLVSMPVCPAQHSPAYMCPHSHATLPMDPGLGHMITNFSAPHSNTSPIHHSNVPSLPSFPSVPTFPQSVSETWQNHIVPTFQNLTHTFTNPNMFDNHRPLPSAPEPPSFIPESKTPLNSPPFLPINFGRSHVSVPPASSALAIMSEFLQEYHHTFPNHPDISPQQWVQPPLRAPTDHHYPLYYTPYPVYQSFQPPPKQPRSVTPKFKIEYSSIHATFLTTIKDADSLKDRKSWPTRKELEARLKWDKNDGWTSSILTARLSDEARNHLPSMIDDRSK